MFNLRIFIIVLCIFNFGCSSLTPQELETSPKVKFQYNVNRNYEAVLKGVLDKWSECSNGDLFRKMEIYPESGEGRVIIYGDFNDTLFLVKAKKIDSNNSIVNVYGKHNLKKRLETIRRGIFGEQLCPKGWPYF